MFLIAAAVLGIGLPVVGIAMAAETGQRAARVVLAVVLALTVLTLVLSAGPTGVRVDETPVQEHNGPPPCVEHSGDEATCPGG